MEDITLKLKEMIKTRKNQKLIYKQSTKMSGSSFIDNLSKK